MSWLHSLVAGLVLDLAVGARALTTTASASSSATPIPSNSLIKCPAANNTIYQAPSGSTWLIECGVDRAGGDIQNGMVYVSNFTQCINDCDSTPNCVDVSLSGAACYRKSAIKQAQYHTDVRGAKLLSTGTRTSTTTSSTSTSTSPGSSQTTTTPTSSSTTTSSASSVAPTMTAPTCPSANGSIFVAQDGSTYVIECYQDRAGNDIKVQQVYSNKIADCINVCASTAGCVDISMAGTACYLKSKIGAPSPNAGVRGARQLAPAPIQSPTTTSSSTASTTTPSSTLSSTVSSTTSVSSLSSATITASATSSSSITSKTTTSTTSTSPLPANLAYGTSCQQDSQCQTGHCVLSTCGIPSQAGGQCKIVTDCASGLLCNLYGQCTSGENGVGCRRNADCKSGYCNSDYFQCQINPSVTTSSSTTTTTTTTSTITTTSKITTTTTTTTSAGPMYTNGADCSRDTDCASGVCTLFTCTSKMINGGPCNYNSNCVSGFCDSTGTCTTGGNNGEKCYFNTDCSSGFCNSNSLCGAQQDGSVCVSNSDCLSTFCDQSDRTCREQDCTGPSCVPVPLAGCRPDANTPTVDCTQNASGGKCNNGQCSISSCRNGMYPFQTVSGVVCLDPSKGCGTIGKFCEYAYTCSASGQTASCVAPPIPNIAGLPSYQDPRVAFPGFPSTNPTSNSEFVTYMTTCCNPAGGSCYNQVATYQNDFIGGVDPRLRARADYVANICQESSNTCNWAQSFTTQDSQNTPWTFTKSELGLGDRNHVAGTMMNVVGDGNRNLACLAADFSTLYYDGENPCVANLACQPIAAGGMITGYINYDFICATPSAVKTASAGFQMYGPDGKVFCSDEFGDADVGYKPTLVGRNCQAIIAQPGHDQIFVEFPRYADGYIDRTPRAVSQTKTTGDCQTERWTFSYTFPGSAEIS